MKEAIEIQVDEIEHIIEQRARHLACGDMTKNEVKNEIIQQLNKEE